MKQLLAAIFLYVLCSSVAANNSVIKSYAIKSPTDIQVLQYLVYKESRGESITTMRAVMDVAYNRAIKNKMTLLAVVKEKGQFPWFAKLGIRKVKDKKFLRKFWNALIMAPVLSKEYLYFNDHKNRHQWATKHKRIGNLVFSQLKEK